MAVKLPFDKWKKEGKVVKKEHPEFLNVTIKSIDTFGKMRMEFDDEILVPNEARLWSKEKFKSILEITVVGAQGQDVDKLGVDYELVEFQSTGLDINLIFENAMYISTASFKDNLNITFIEF